MVCCSVSFHAAHKEDGCLFGFLGFFFFCKFWSVLSQPGLSERWSGSRVNKILYLNCQICFTSPFALFFLTFQLHSFGLLLKVAVKHQLKPRVHKCHHQSFMKHRPWNLNLKLETECQCQFIMIRGIALRNFKKGSKSELASTIILVVMREHRDQLDLVLLPSVSHHKNTSFRLWARLTPGRGPVLTHWDQSPGNWCWISSWGKQMKIHSTKLALESSLYFWAGRSRNLSSWPG